MFRVIVNSCLPIVLLLSTGCGSAGPTFVEVEGVVTLEGKPVDKIHVEFWPEVEGPRSSGITDAEGRFVLATADGLNKGAVKGRHKVVLSDTSIIGVQGFGRDFEDVDITKGQKPRILEAYKSPLTTKLTVDITGENKNVTLEAEPNPNAKKK